MRDQIITAMKDTEIGGGQFWHSKFDPYNSLTFEESHATLSTSLQQMVNEKKATAILLVPGSIFPQGRVQTTVFKGIDPDQKILDLPADTLNIGKKGNKGKTIDLEVIPALIGTRMAKQANLKVGDIVTARWRDAQGTFDATEIKIVHVMKIMTPNMDAGQVWLPLNKLRQMIEAPRHTTILTIGQNQKVNKVPEEGEDAWIYRDLDYLLKEVKYMIKTKRISNLIFYGILFGMGLLAIFDTQVLAIWRRRKEMGTMMALGMSRLNIISLFTLEGSLHGILAFFVGAIYGIPLMIHTTVHGIKLPDVTEEFGFAMGTTLYTTYGVPVFLLTVLLLFLTVVVVSFLPTRKITRLKPTDALRGKMS